MYVPSEPCILALWGKIMAGGHHFGGEHTEDKLRYVEAYLQSWVNVLKNQGYERIYIDGFAGTGSRTVITSAAPLLGEDRTTRLVAGSAKIALGISPSFDRYILIESEPKKFKELEGLKSEFPDKTIELIPGDANQFLKKFCRLENWKGQGSSSWGSRAVLLLDPYGMNVDWSTLQAIADTEAIDMWFLFSIGGLIRQAAHRWEAVEGYKIDRIDRYLGTKDWHTVFCEETEEDLFGHTEKRRTADEKALNNYVKGRLGEIFGWVSEPIPIRRHDTNVLLFSLFFGIGSRSEKAVGAAKRIVTHLQKLSGA